MVLCEGCTTALTYSTLNPSLEVRRAEPSCLMIRLWPCFQDLDNGANSGCELCKLFRLYLTNFVSYEKLCSSTLPVKLHRWGDDLGLNCEGYSGTIIVHVVDSEAPNGFAAELLQQNVYSLENKDQYEQARRWLRACLTDHGDCRYADSESLRLSSDLQTSRSSIIAKLPKRLLDLAYGDVVYIVDCLKLVEEGFLSLCELQWYCTLSYQWGTTTHDCTLTDSFDFLLEIPMSSMPATFSDAIVVARRLGLRFLWIDALCIVQPTPDSDEEWLRESARMGVIYENAVVTIAATRAICVHDGFRNDGNVFDFTANACVIYETSSDTIDTTEALRSVTLPVSMPDFSECVTHSTLNMRGWVMQERALSRRIIHFTHHGLFWECGSLKATQYAPEGLRGHYDFPSCRSKETMLTIARIKRTGHVCPVEWFHFIKQYSCADFTQPSDRLLALSAVARAVCEYLGSGPYLAGLWRKDLLRGLCWFTRSRRLRRPDQILQAPSWSWASVPGGIDFTVFDITTWNHDLAEVIDVCTELVDPSNVFGSIQRGILKFNGTITQRTFTVDVDNERAGHVRDGHEFEYWDESQADYEVLLRSKLQNDDAGGSECMIGAESRSSLGLRQFTFTRHCLPIAWGSLSYSGDNRKLICALILTPVGFDENGQIISYRRIGWAQWQFWSVEYLRYTIKNSNWKSNWKFDAKKWVNMNPTTVTII